MQIFFGGAWREITSAQVFANGAWRDLVQIQEYFSSAWREVANFTAAPGDEGSGSPLTVAATPSTITTHGGASQTSAAFTATPSGGLAPYTYVWSFNFEAAGPVFTINSPTLATTTVSATGLSGSKQAWLLCDCTDALGAHANTNTVVVATFINP